jgi:hypothetical protein
MGRDKPQHSGFNGLTKRFRKPTATTCTDSKQDPFVMNITQRIYSPPSSSTRTGPP